MKKRLSQFSIHQTSKVAALLYFVLTALFLFPYAIYILFVLDWENAFFAFLAPFFYGIISYIVTAIITFIYNQIAAITGGIEFTIDDV